jgi:DNA mismatch repair protein MutS2
LKVDRKTLQELEFYTFIDTLKDLSFSPYGRKYFDNLKFDEDPREAYLKVIGVTDVFQQINSLLSKVEYMEEPLKSILNGKRIGTKDLVDFGELFRVSKKISDLLLSVPSMVSIAVQMIPPKGFVEFCDKTFNPDGSVKDSASPELVRIRKEIHGIEQEIDDRIKKMIAEGVKSGYISEALVVQRHERYVLPVDAQSRSKVKGIIHGQSATGETYYVEPEEMIELNDALAIARSKESIEISKIVNNGIDMIVKNADMIFKLMNAMGEFDFIYAKVSYSLKNSCIIPVVRTDGFIKVVGGRNPLIPNDKVVPIDVEIKDTDRVIVVSGPNMGGKTAFLKTIGLFSLMSAVGIPIPAKNGTELSLFQSLYSDIGDDQSVKNELSTFSARVLRENEICKISNAETIVLIDEIGEGTEPSEGAAFAKSILDILISKGTKVFVTTHLLELKNLAYSVKNVRNASVGFDIEKMEPTYRVYMDLPGRSRALEIIEKMGVSKEIIENFKKNRSTAFSNGDMLIEELQTRIRDYEDKLENITQREKVLEQKEKDYESKFEKLKSKEIAELSSEVRLLSDQILKIKKETEEAIHRLRSSKNEEELVMQNKRLEELRKILEKSETRRSSNLFFDSNSYVKIKGTDVIGKIKSLKKDSVILDVEGSNVEISPEKIEKIEKPQKIKTDRENVEYVKNEKISNEIDLRGLTVEDAIPLVEEFIERMIKSNSVGFIIHGKGTGKLSNGIWSFLRSKHVKFRIGREGEGGTGVTVIGE